MKKALLIIGAMAFTMAAPVVSAAPASSSTPVAQSAAADEQAAINRYIFNTAAATMDVMADAMENSDGSEMAQAKIFISSLEVMTSMPIDELPARHQPFIKEGYADAAKHLAALKAVLANVENGELGEDAAMEKMAEITQACLAEQAALEAKYPESAKVLGQEASKKLTENLMPELQAQAMPRIQAYFAEHPEEAGDQVHVLAVSFRIIGQLFREMAPAK